MSSNPELLSKITDFESRLAFQEDAIATLSDQLAWQAKTIDLQERKIVKLTEHISQLKQVLQHESQDIDGGIVEDQPPPHY